MLSRTTALVLGIAGLCACSNLRTVPLVAPAASGAVNQQPTQPDKAGPYLYVAGTSLSQYALGSSKPLRSVPMSYGANAIAFDSYGRIFVTNGGGSYGTIPVLDARNLTLLRTIGGSDSIYVATNRAGYVYASNCGRGIDLFTPGGVKWLHPIFRRISKACALAFNSTDDLFVINAGAVTVFAPAKEPGHVNFLRRLTAGVNRPRALTIGPLNELYVANCPSCGPRKEGRQDAFVSVFAPGASKPRRILTGALAGPSALAVDRSGRVYVACSPFSNRRGVEPGWVTVFAPGATHPLRKITEKIDAPSSLAFDPSGNLYVANSYGASVTVYSPSGLLLRTITDGAAFARAVAIGG